MLKGKYICPDAVEIRMNRSPDWPELTVSVKCKAYKYKVYKSIRHINISAYGLF